eukprot:408888-Rhodomonas_salina.1
MQHGKRDDAHTRERARWVRDPYRWAGVSASPNDCGPGIVHLPHTMEEFLRRVSSFALFNGRRLKWGRRREALRGHLTRYNCTAACGAGGTRVPPLNSTPHLHPRRIERTRPRDGAAGACTQPSPQCRLASQRHWLAAPSDAGRRRAAAASSAARALHTGSKPNPRQRRRGPARPAGPLPRSAILGQCRIACICASSHTESRRCSSGLLSTGPCFLPPMPHLGTFARPGCNRCRVTLQDSQMSVTSARQSQSRAG